MEAVCTSETSVNFNVTTCHYTPEDSKLHTCRCENLKSHMQKTCPFGDEGAGDLHTSVVALLEVPCCWSRWSPCFVSREGRRWCGLVLLPRKLFQEWQGHEACWYHACAVQLVHLGTLCVCLPPCHSQCLSVTGNACAGFQCGSRWMGDWSSHGLRTCEVMCWSTSCNTKHLCTLVERHCSFPPVAAI
jgi:hypothetical protein